MRGNASTMIGDNPQSITITRTTKTRSGGKLTSSTSTVAAQTVRLYSTKGELERGGDEMRWIRSRTVKMLCLWNANVKPHNELNEDTFSVLGITYRIQNVRDVSWNASVIAKECTLEEIRHVAGL